MLRSNQVVPYDNASKVLRSVAEQLGNINVVGLDAEHRAMIEVLQRQAAATGSEMFSLAHERFVAERAGDVKPGE
jgi:hypothetical protein